MRVALFVGGLRKGGIERLVVALANYHIKIGNEVDVLVLDDHSPEYPLSEKAKIVLIGSGLTLQKSYRSVIKRFRDIRTYIKKGKPNAVICFSNIYAFYSIIALIGTKIKTICCIHTNPYSQKRGKMVKILEKILLPFADGFTFETVGAQAYYNNIIRRKSVVIPNGLTAEDLPQSPTRYEEREHKKFCAVGRLNKIKDYPSLIEIFYRFNQKYPGYTLDIFGEGTERLELQKLISELNLDEHVFLRGNCDNVVQRISNYGMYLMTSKSEGWSLSLLEAMACGLPSVAYDCDFGPREMIQNGINGVLVPIGDRDTFIKGMVSIITDKAFAERISENALTVREKFSEKKYFEKHHQFLLKVVGNDKK